MTGEKLKQYLLGKQPEMLALLETMVNIDSGSYCKEGVDAVGRIMAERLEELGFTAETSVQASTGNHVIARRQGTSGKRLLLIAHLDTVFPAGSAQKNPFRVVDGRAYGPGVLDMKSCLLGALYAIESLQATGADPLPAITLLMVGDEEIGSATARDIIHAEGKKADWALVVEAARANGAIVTERKGNGFLDLTAIGRAAHAGIEPQAGINAIEELALKIVRLRKLNDFAAGTTVTLGLMSGGEARNVVAAEATAKIDLRFRTSEAAKTLFADIEAILAEPELPGIKLEYNLHFNRPPLLPVPGSETLLAITAAASEELGIPLLTAATGGVTDGNFTSALGVPTLDGLGPVGGCMCSPDEYLEVATWPDRTARLALIIAKLGKL